MKTLNLIQLSLFPLALAGSAARANPTGIPVWQPYVNPSLCEAVIDAPVPNPFPATDAHQCKRVNMTLDSIPQQTYLDNYPDNCFTTWNNVFVCYFKTGQEACDAKTFSHDHLSGLPDYNEDGMTCTWNDGGGYWILAEKDGTQKAQLRLQQQPLEASDAIDGPYSNISDGSEPIVPGRAFGCRMNTVMKANWDHYADGRYHSDLAGFPFACPTPTAPRAMCVEPDDLSRSTPVFYQIVPKTDARGCGLGTNSFANAAVISSKLASALSNNPKLAESAAAELEAHFKY